VASVASEGSSGVSEVGIAILPDSCGGFVFEGLCDIPQLNVSSLVMTREYVACVYQVIANECNRKEFMSYRARDDLNVILGMGVLPPVESFNSVFPIKILRITPTSFAGNCRKATLQRYRM
jgi:hypothetical protein